MAAISLEILEPANGLTLAGTGAVHFRGRMLAPAPVPLFFKWYASLEAPNPPGSPLPGGTTLDFTTTLSVGTQIITLSVKDVVGDDEASLKNAQHGGMAGGPPSTSNPQSCLITVLLAEIVTPLAGATLSKALSQLVAIAPRQWANPAYQAVNRVKYIWRFTPIGAPPGRAAAVLEPPLNQLSFDGSFAAAGNRPVVIYRGALPGSLGIGAYQITLRLQDANNAASAHEVSRNVILTA